MGKKIYIVSIIVVSLLALAAILQTTLKAKAIVKIKWSEFKSTHEIADSLRLRLRQETKDHNVLFLGVEPGEKSHLEIWKEWIQLNDEPGWHIDAVYVEPALNGIKEVFPQSPSLDVRQFQDQVVQLLKQNTNKRLVFIVPHVYAAQLIKDNPVTRIQTESGIQIMSMTLVPLVNESSLSCEASGSDYTGQSPLGCLVREKNFFYQKKITHSMWSGLVEQYGLNDYVVFLKANFNH